jgi:hypothetical protein
MNNKQHWKKLFLITYWLRNDKFNIITFLFDIYIIFIILTVGIYSYY